jgi:mRNA interferase MazF
VISSSLQWTVFRARLDPTEGSEQAGARPVLVVSREVINQALPIVGVVPLTTRKQGRRVYPTEVLLPAMAAGQPEDSIAMAHQIRTISRGRLGKPFGELTDPDLRGAVREAIRIYLDL